MRAQVLSWTTIPTCVGLGPSKALAKLGNAAAKKNPLFDGVADLRDEAIRTWVLNRFDVADVWGVGSATAAKLDALGIRTAGQLRDMPMKQARAVGTVVLERLVAELRGVPAGAIETAEPQRKGMAVTRSFGTPVNDFPTLMGALAQYAMRAGEKLRSHGLVAARLTVFFHTNRFKPDRPQYGASRLVALHPMTNDSLELIAAARRGAQHACHEGAVFRRMIVRRYAANPALAKQGWGGKAWNSRWVPAWEKGRDTSPARVEYDIGANALHAGSVTPIFREILRRAFKAGSFGDLDAKVFAEQLKQISAHSTRVGINQDYFAAGENLAGIMDALRWKSPRMPLLCNRNLAAEQGAAGRLLGELE